MNIEYYWHDIDSRLEQLLEKGFVKLPSLSIFDLDFLANSISDEMGSLTFKELGSAHKNFLKHFLAIGLVPFHLNTSHKPPKLHHFSMEEFHKSVRLSRNFNL